MAQDETDRIRERLRQGRTALDRAARADSVSPLCAEGRMGCAYTAGARVFDRVSGLEGEVIGGARENVIVSATRLNDR